MEKTLSTNQNIAAHFVIAAIVAAPLPLSEIIGLIAAIAIYYHRPNKIPLSVDRLITYTALTTKILTAAALITLCALGILTGPLGICAIIAAILLLSCVFALILFEICNPRQVRAFS